jgi:tryptophan synthase alpha chain
VLESHLRDKLKEKPILLMTHIVLGYPSFEEGFSLVEAMVKGGVDLVELQIPFSEPIADGPVIVGANERALRNGATVERCIDHARDLAESFSIPFLIMTYYNIPFRYGMKRFVATMAKNNLRGAIIPDLPPEEGEEYLAAMAQYGLAPIFTFSPSTSSRRMKTISSFGEGFIYCVARKGVTGSKTQLSEDTRGYLERARKATSHPLAVGFGIRTKADIDFLRRKADIAVIGTETLRIMEKEGIASVGNFVSSLR